MHICKCHHVCLMIPILHHSHYTECKVTAKKKVTEDSNSNMNQLSVYYDTWTKWNQMGQWLESTSSPVTVEVIGQSKLGTDASKTVKASNSFMRSMLIRNFCINLPTLFWPSFKAFLVYGICRLNAVIKRIALLLCTQEVPSSNLGLQTCHPDWGFHSVLQHLRQMPGWYYKLGHNHIFPCSFQFIVY